MRTKQEAELKAAELEAANCYKPVTFGVDQSIITWAWRVIEYRDGYQPTVAAS